MPVDRGAIDAQLREIGEGDRWWEQREFRDLPYILHDDELIRGIVVGRLLGPVGPRLKAGRPWLIVATDQRLLCVRQERFGRKQIDIAAVQIHGVRQSSRFSTYQLTIQTAQRSYRIRIPKDDALRFAAAVAALLPNRASQAFDASPQLWPWMAGFPAVAALPAVAGIVSKVSMLSPPDYATRDRVDDLEATVEALHKDVQRLRQQVAFLEDLLQQRAEERILPPSSIDV